MPRTTSTTPPIDPFPPLPQNGLPQPSSSSGQTYAEIAARRASNIARINARRGEIRNELATRAATAVRGDGSTTLHNHSPFWSVDDIDRQDSLDELNLNTATVPLPTVAAPSPPWRRRRMQTSGVLDPRPLPPSRFTGDPADDEFIVEDDPEESGANGLDPVFTLDDLMEEDAPRPGAISRASTATGGPSMRRMNPFTLADTGIPLWTTTSAPEGVSAARSTWDGGITAARRNGYGTDMADEVQNLYGAITGSTSAGDAANPSQTLRRRRRILRRLAEDGTGLGGEIHAWNSMIDMPADEDRWSRSTLYMQPNLTGDDVRLWQGNGPGLHRGGNNRRRAPSGTFREAHGMDDRPVLLPTPSGEDMRRESSGMAPTNTASSRASTPLVVQSRTRKVREEKPSEEECAQPHKKRRLNPSAPEFRPRSLPLTRPTYLSYTTLGAGTPLPDAFDPPHRTSHLALTTLHRPNAPPRPVITFTLHPMPTHTDADASALRANRAIPKACGIHYYEAEVLDQGEAGYMSVGWMMRGADLGRLVGWDPGSWGWHADDGRSFEGQGKGESFAEKWGTGDIVGCGVDFTTGKAFFTKNGKLMGHRFSKLSHGLHPAVGLKTPRESVAVNFTGPFMFDIDKYVRDKRDAVWASALAHSVAEVPRLLFARDAGASPAKGGAVTSDPEDSPEVLTAKLHIGTPKAPLPTKEEANKADAETRTTAAWVLDYLRHHGYSSSSRLLHRDLARRSLAPAVAEPKGKRKRNVPPEDLRLEDFDDRKAAIQHLESLASSSLPLPSGLVGDLDASGLEADEQVKELRNRMLVGSFVRRLRNLPLPNPQAMVGREDEEIADKALESVLAFGQSLRSSCQVQKWTNDTQQLLAEAFGLLGTAPSAWRSSTVERWESMAKKNGEELGQYLRRINNLKARSYLESSIAHTRNLTKMLRDTGGAEVAFVDVARVWEESIPARGEDDEEVGGEVARQSKRRSGAGVRKRRRGSEGEVEEVVEVKEEKAA